MPHYFFHFRTAHGLDADETGCWCADLDAAYLEAFRTARDMWRDTLMGTATPLARAIEIADPEGRLLMEVPFQEVIDTCGQGRRPPPAPERRQAREMLERTARVSAEIVAQVEAARQALRRSQDLLGFGTDDPLAGEA